MPVSALPDLDHVFAKWEKKGAAGHMTKTTDGSRNGREIRNADAKMMDGKRRWREKFGQNIQPLRQRRIREKPRTIAVPVETVSL